MPGLLATDRAGKPQVVGLTVADSAIGRGVAQRRKGEVSAFATPMDLTPAGACVDLLHRNLEE